MFLIFARVTRLPWNVREILCVILCAIILTFICTYTQLLIQKNVYLHTRTYTHTHTETNELDHASGLAECNYPILHGECERECV